MEVGGTGRGAFICWEVRRGGPGEAGPMGAREGRGGAEVSGRDQVVGVGGADGFRGLGGTGCGSCRLGLTACQRDGRPPVPRRFRIPPPLAQSFPVHSVCHISGLSFPSCEVGRIVAEVPFLHFRDS